jgi:hypothetical protein
MTDGSRQTFRQGATGDRHYDRLIIAKVIKFKDVDPGKGGDLLAKLRRCCVPGGPTTQRAGHHGGWPATMQE